MCSLLAERASVFLLHRFSGGEAAGGGHDPRFVAACLEELRKRRIEILSLDELVERGIAGEAVGGRLAFTMDDGFWDQGEIGAELFLAYDVPVTCFLITGFQDLALWPWDQRLAWVYEHTRVPRLQMHLEGMTLDQHLGDQRSRTAGRRATRAHLKRVPHERIEPALQALAEAAEVEIPRGPPGEHRPIGWDRARQLERRGVRFGPHTVSHGIVSQMTEREARADLLQGGERIRAELSAPLDIYGWPTGRSGDFSERDQAIVQGAGYRAAMASDDDYAWFPTVDPGRERYRLKRFALPETRSGVLQYATWIERSKQVLRGRG